MKKIEHLGIAVANLQESITVFEKLLNTTCYKTEEVISEGVRTAFFQVGASKIELLEATNPSSPIAKFLEYTKVQKRVQIISVSHFYIQKVPMVFWLNCVRKRTKISTSISIHLLY
jgi:hypothetical protein